MKKCILWHICAREQEIKPTWEDLFIWNPPDPFQLKLYTCDDNTDLVCHSDPLL